MTQQNDLDPFDTSSDSVAGQPAAPPSGGMSLKRIHSMMRGRYLLAATLFVIGAGIGAPIGLKLVQPQYKSTGALRVKATLDRILRNNESTNVIPMWDSFMTTQVSYLRSEGVIKAAMEDPAWRDLKRGVSPEAIAEFMTNLTVDHAPSNELIFVVYTDRDPVAARVAVGSVIRAYVNKYGSSEYGAPTKVIEQLTLDLNTSTDTRQSLLRDISKLYTEAGTVNLDRFADQKSMALQRANDRLEQIRSAIEQMELSPKNNVATTQAVVTPKSLARVDRTMADLLNEQAGVERERWSLTQRYGPQSKFVLENASRLQDVAKRIETRFKELKDAPELAVTPEVAGGFSLEKLREKEATAKKDIETLTLENRQLVGQIQQLREWNDKLYTVEERIKEIKLRMEDLAQQGRVGNRLDIASDGDTPFIPTVDKRKTAAAGLGMLLGCLGAGLVVLRAYTDPRVRHIADAEQPILGSPRVLGVVPAMLATEDDPDRITSTAHSVHNVRVQLQMEVNPAGPRCIVMTSPAPGSGKTSLTMALGVSFAATGSRTLLIDCDPVGGGLTAMTRRINRRRIGRILVQQGIISEDQLEAALDEAVRTGRKVGEVIEDSGLADSATIAKALEAQAASMQGLRQALRGEDLTHCIVDAGVPDLYVLTLGDMSRHHAGRISPGAIKALFERAKLEFDTVLVDTGPILGGLESMMAASMADGVVVALSSGEHKPLVQRAFDSLTQARVNLVGVVFNRAKNYDLMTSTFSSSVVRHSVARLPAPNPTSGKRRVIETEGVSLGPIGSAVATINDRDDEEDA